MPNPNEPSEWECKRCHDTGYIPGTYTLCDCVAGDVRFLALDEGSE